MPTSPSPRRGIKAAPVPIVRARPLWPRVAVIALVAVLTALGFCGTLILAISLLTSTQALDLRRPERLGEVTGRVRAQVRERIAFVGPDNYPVDLEPIVELSTGRIVAAELVGAQTGLGYMISNAALLFQIPVVYVGVALIGILGLAMNLALNAIEAKVVHWKGRG